MNYGLGFILVPGVQKGRLGIICTYVSGGFRGLGLGVNTGSLCTDCTPYRYPLGSLAPPYL